MNPIHIQYNSSVMVLSILIAIFASYISIELVNMSRSSNRINRKMWFISGAFAMGLGIWTMHFTGMLAIGISEMDILLHIITTIISLIVAIAGPFIAFQFVTLEHIKQKHIFLACFFMGSSIISIHYIGIYTVNFNRYIEHDIPTMLWNIFIAYSGSYLTLLIFSKISYRRLYVYQLPLAVLLGIVISSIHYIAMNSFYDISFYFHTHSILNILVLVIAIFFVIIYSLDMHNKKTQQQMYQMAFYDSLTELPNRYYLEHQFQETLDNSASTNETFAVFFLDLDNFKEVNDRYGHEVGDDLLMCVANMLTLTVEDHMMVSRHGGDEFIILAKKTEEQKASMLVEKIQRQFYTPFTVNNLELPVTSSIGVSFYPEDGTDMKTLINHADKAMYKAKEKGKREK